jgi:hypothetical protein
MAAGPPNILLSFHAKIGDAEVMWLLNGLFVSKNQLLSWEPHLVDFHKCYWPKMLIGPLLAGKEFWEESIIPLHAILRKKSQFS